MGAGYPAGRFLAAVGAAEAGGGAAVSHPQHRRGGCPASGAGGSPVATAAAGHGHREGRAPVGDPHQALALAGCCHVP